MEGEAKMNHEEYRQKVIQLQQRITRLEAKIAFYQDENHRLKKLIQRGDTHIKTAQICSKESQQDGRDFQEDFNKFRGGIWTET
jgi:multidrug resistance efflux pump